MSLILTDEVTLRVDQRIERRADRLDVTMSLHPESDGWSATAHDQTDDKQNQEDDEQNLCNHGSGSGQSTKAQCGSDQSDYQKRQSPTQHSILLRFLIVFRQHEHRVLSERNLGNAIPVPN
ncbi:hypothetical protein [Rhodopirellula sp. P2]|uniref:hypothetical protein n=1 Tax=Rhodopirellula sp. P2 TaxID=2127060 RepID=UPI003FD522C8